MAITATLLSLALFSSANADCDYWTYIAQDDCGPPRWPFEFEGCDGMQQSPIDLPAVIDEPSNEPGLTTLVGAYKSTEITWRNSGDQLTATFNDPEEQVLTGGAPLVEKVERNPGPSALNFHNLVSMHFHWSVHGKDAGSEHTVNGEHWPLCLHLVHQQAEADWMALMVLGFSFVEGEANPALEEILSQFPDEFYEDDTFTMDINVESFFSQVDPSEYYLYAGSLTTPTCDENVTWVLFNEILTASAEQIEAFNNIRRDGNTYAAPNIRTLMPLNDRPIYNAKAFTPAAADPNEGSIVIRAWKLFLIIGALGLVVLWLGHSNMKLRQTIDDAMKGDLRQGLVDDSHHSLNH